MILLFLFCKIQILRSRSLGCLYASQSLTGCTRACRIGYAYYQESPQGSISCLPCTDCLCPIGYYYELGNQERTVGCNPCPQSCRNCSNPYFCDDGTCNCTENEKQSDLNEEACLKCFKIIKIVPNIRLLDIYSCGSGGNTGCGCTFEHQCYQCYDSQMQVGQHCINPSSLLSCDVGYYFQSPLCRFCKSPCYDCASSATNCKSCIAKTYLSGNSCLDCNTSCATCTSSSYCTSCISGYYLSQATCIACNPCLLCTHSTNCQSCMNGYYLSGTTCMQCTTPCLTAAGSIITSCISTSYLSGNSCKWCVSPCMQCTGLANCQSCINGYYLQGTTCINCTSPCLTASGSIITSCIPTSYLSANSCISCVSPCVQCTSPTICQSCMNGYFLQINTCQICVSPCLTASGSFITQCISTTYLSGNTCPSCVSPCVNCTSQVSCNTCISQYYLSGATCLYCTSPCLSVSNSEITQCIQTTFLSGPSLCASCVSPCLTCINVNSCQSCVNGYFFDGFNACYPCRPPCLTCEGNAMICTSCLPTTYLYDDKCPNCVSPCATCTSSIDCVTCINGYYLDSIKGCLICQAGCAFCTDGSSCQVCIEPYYYKNITQCQICQNPCLTCLPQLDINNNNLCLSCVNNLSLSAYECSCLEGQYLENDSCTQCDQTCSSCSADICFKCKDQNSMFISTNKCICKDGYFENNGQCYQCGSQCALCKTSVYNCTQCSNQLMIPINGLCSCKQGYYLKDSLCQKCDEQCSTCDVQSNKCTSCRFANSYLYQSECVCQNGYYLNSAFLCVLCQTNCITCQSRDQCTICQLDYYLSNNSCVSCPIGCNICRVNESYIDCILCDDGYELVAYECQPAHETTTLNQNNFLSYVGILNSKNQMKITNDEIFVEGQFANMYKNNDIIINIQYSTKIYTSQISINIYNFNETQFTYAVNTQQKFQGETHTIFFNFSQTITSLDLIYTQIQFSSTNNVNQCQQEVFIIVPNNFQVLTEQQSQVISKVQTIQSGVQTSLLISVALASILGGFSLILSICDILAWLSTFYYLNITYPYNVNFIFQNINLQQFLFLPSFDLGLDQLEDNEYFQSPYKFMQNSVDPLFINNTLNDCLLIISPVLLYIVSRVYLKIDNILEIAKHIKRNENKNRKSVVIVILNYLLTNAQYFNNYHKAVFLKQIHLNMLDLTLACCLQLMSNPPNQYIFILVNSGAALFTSLFIIYLCYQVYLSCKKDKLFHKTKAFQEQYQPIYDNIIIDSFEQRSTGCIVLYCKILYIILLVLLYKNPILQTASCAGQYFLLNAYLIYVKPYKKWVIEVVPNLCVLAILLTTSFLAVNEKIQLVQDIESIGWVMIGFICISMGTQFYFLLKHLVHQIVSKFK